MKTKEHPQTLDEINLAIKIPSRLFTDDGREVLITRWEPSASIGDPVHVEIGGCIMIDLPR